MPSKYPQHLLQGVIAALGDYVIPPNTNEMAGDGRLSIQNGWDVETSTPLEQGGVPPRREDFNGALNLLSQFLVWYQQGGLMNYSSSFDYEVGNEILQNGVKYRCVTANGPSSAVVAPGTDPTIWKNMDIKVPAGAVMPFSNVTLGGSDGRRPIFWGSTTPDESWVLCDGGASGIQDVSVPNLIGRNIIGSSVDQAGQVGGSENVTIRELPAHTHAITIAQNGNHTHTRGTMNITGGFTHWDATITPVLGAFYDNNSQYSSKNGKSGAGEHSGYVAFDASRSWTGSTSSNGAHAHTATCQTVGNGDGVTVSTLSPFYKMAYFVKLPE